MERLLADPQLLTHLTYHATTVQLRLRFTQLGDDLFRRMFLSLQEILLGPKGR